MRPLELDEAEYIAHSLANELMNFDEPMPPFETRYRGKLEACLSAPFQTFDGKELYPRIARKAAILFYGVIKGHPFINGNKRMAVTLTMVFFYVNGKWFQVPPNELYSMACSVAESKPENRDKVVDLLVTFFNKNLENRDVAIRSVRAN